MSEEKKDEGKDKRDDARDLEPKKDAKGGGTGWTKQSPSGGGTTPQPITPGE